MYPAPSAEARLLVPHLFLAAVRVAQALCIVREGGSGAEERREVWWNLALQAWLAQSYRQGVLACDDQWRGGHNSMQKAPCGGSDPAPQRQKASWRPGTLSLSLPLSLYPSISLLPLDLPFLVTVRLVRVVSLTEAATAVEPTTLQVVLV